MFGLFKCKHPADELHVQRVHTIEQSEETEFKHVTYHLYCYKCGDRIDIKFATAELGEEEKL